MEEKEGVTTEEVTAESANVPAEDVFSIIAEKVREKSMNEARLVSLTSILPDMTPEEAGAKLVGLAEDEHFQDIKALKASTGTVYLYSATYITDNYAGILIRAEENDPCVTIAATVRNEAKTYPRATRTEYFMNPIFNINPDELDKHIAGTMERPEFKDIKSITASTGTRFLYSDLYLNEGYARSLIEWEEVGQYDNP